MATSNRLGCGFPLLKQIRKVFCSNQCQRSAERVAKVAVWLSTGIADVGGERGHYVRRYLLDARDGCCDICGIVEEWNGRPLAA